MCISVHGSASVGDCVRGSGCIRMDGGCLGGGYICQVDWIRQKRIVLDGDYHR